MLAQRQYVPRVTSPLLTPWSVSRRHSFDRMQKALETFAVDDLCLSGYIYHTLLGHRNLEPQELDVKVPDDMSVSGLPKLNDSQSQALKEVLRSPFSLVQGPPGTGKTVTSAALVYWLVKGSKEDQVRCRQYRRCSFRSSPARGSLTPNPRRWRRSW